MLKNIFSIVEYNDTHNIARILGIKIKYPKREFAQLKKQMPFENYKKQGFDISKIPPAEGQLREIQLANLALLKEMDYVCKQANLEYWIDFGTLLGAVRHKGFIPWDDDVDLGMLRSDYEKIIEAFKKYSRNPDIFANYYRCNNNSSQIIIKIQHKKCPHLFVDIFPYDISTKILTNKDQLEETIQIKKVRKEIETKCSLKMDDIEVLNIIKTYRQKLFQATSYKDSDYDLCWGIEFNHHWENWFANKEMIFPLKEIKLENSFFPCINDIEGYLEKVYGNYMNYPKKFGFGHNMFAKLSKEEAEVIKDLIRS